MRLAPFGAAAALALVQALAVSAQVGDLAARAGPETLAAVQGILDEAAGDSLPVRALESKVLEGVAKNVPPERIGQVVARLAGELRAVRAALREALPDQPLLDGEVVAVATAARQGLDVETVRPLWVSRSEGEGGSLEVPLTVLGELVRRGVPVPDAVSLMTHVVATSVPLPVAAQIPGKFDGAVGSGASPAAALGQALRNLNIPDPPGRGGNPPSGRGRRPPG